VTPIESRKRLKCFENRLDHEPSNAAALVTYYAVDAIRYLPPPLPSLETLDVAYLPAVILAGAGRPLSDTYRERLRLMTGRYHGCPEIPGFHRRLIDAGIIDAW
jgi:hypothetical protein